MSRPQSQSDLRRDSECGAHPAAGVHQAAAGPVRMGLFAQKLGVRCLEARPGYCRMEMVVTAEMTNLFGMGHGGAIFTLMDEAFQIACNSHGVKALALNISVTYLSATKPGERLVAEARELNVTRRTGAYDLRVIRGEEELVAVAQALAYRKTESRKETAPTSS